MSLLDQLGNAWKQYTGTSANSAANAAASESFEQVAQSAPPSVIAEGLSAVFRSDHTPAFGDLISGLFNQSNAEQKAGILNHLISTVGLENLPRSGRGRMLANLLGEAKQFTPQQTENVSPEHVRQIATRAEKSDSSIVDKASAFYSQHPTLVKTLGGGALSIALAKVAGLQKAA